MYDNSLDEMFEQDRNQSIQWTKEVLQDPNLIILDTETTGLDGDAEVVQIAIIDGNGNILFNSLVKPLRGIRSEALAINHITEAMVENAPTFKDIFPTLQKIIEDKRLVIYNANYDMRVMHQSGDDLPPFFNVIVNCAMEAYAKYVSDWNDYYGSYRWQKLPSGDHSALGDCLATLKLIKQMAGTHEG